MRITTVIAMVRGLGEAELLAWVERGWVRPEGADTGWEFHEIDVARIRLIHDLRYRMEMAEETIPVVLSLLDQIHDLRGDLRSVLRAVERQPEAVRRAILSEL
ncbi:MAG: chaperone modulator CbpM [Acetobacteraceae bacterium]